MNASAAPGETVTTQLQALATDIEQAIADQVPDTKTRKPLFFDRLQEARRMAEEFEDIGPSGTAFLRVVAFPSSFNLDWYAVAQS